MMSFKKKLRKYVQKKQDQIQRGREISMQMKDEQLRKKEKQYQHMKPGAKKAILDGLKTKSSPLDVMKQEYERRKYERHKKYH